MTDPTLPNADELEVVAYWHECRNKNGQLWDWTVSQDAEMEFSTEHAPGSGEDYVSIAKPLVTLSSAQAQIASARSHALKQHGRAQTYMNAAVGWQRRAEAAEAEVKRLKALIDQHGSAKLIRLSGGTSNG